MKIVMLCDFYDQNLLYQENLIAAQYVKLGHQVTIVASTIRSIFDYMANKYDRGVPGSVSEAKGVKIVRRPYRINLLNRLRSFGRLDDLLREEAPDLIFLHGVDLNVVSAVRYRRRHSETRMILDYHADYTNSAHGWLSKRVLHGILRRMMLDHA